MYQISYRPKEATMQEERALASSSSDAASASASIYSGMDKRIMDEIKRVEIKQHFGSKIDMSMYPPLVLDRDLTPTSNPSPPLAAPARTGL
jgi:hypothetical protein